MTNNDAGRDNYGQRCRRGEAERVDVTDLLVREFRPGEKQLKVIADLKTKKPVSLDQIDKLKDH